MRLKNPTTGYCVETSTDTATRHLIACGFNPVDEEADAQPEKKPRARRKKTDETEQKEG